MKTKLLLKTVCTATLMMVANGAQAQVSADEVARLGKDLTPIGAEMAGNAAGTIPAWTGGFLKDYKTPEGYIEGKFHPNPFPDDKILFTITSENIDKYRNNLSAGQIALLKAHPATYKMHVYKTRRTAGYKDVIYNAAKKNAANASLVPGGNGIQDMVKTLPFPIPNNGAEVVWNHVTRYRGEAARVYSASAGPQRNGSYTLHKDEGELVFNELMGTDDKKLGNIIFFFKQKTTAPTRRAGDVLLVHETLDQSREPRLAWTYSTGQRRVRRAPQVAFDTARGVDGLRTADNLDVFNGSPERYDWVIEGKEEIYIPYNNYEFAQPSNRYTDILQKGHPSTEKLRYELHRVWKVTGKVKAGMSHIYATRTFYIDEDSWQVTLADQYDGKGKLWRFSEAYAMNYYEEGIHWNVGETHHDLIAGRYLIEVLSNEEKRPRDFAFADNNASKLVNYTPGALRRGGIR